MRAVSASRPEQAVPSLLKQAVIFPAALSAIVALVLVGEVRALVSLSQWVKHTDHVMDAAHGVEQILIDRESAFRGFRTAPRTEFLPRTSRRTGPVGRGGMASWRWSRDNPPHQAGWRAL